MAVEETEEGIWHRVCLNTIVRKGAALDSERLRILPMGSKVNVVETRDRRVRISQPLAGWCSLKSSNGDTILTQINAEEGDGPSETPTGARLHQKVDRERQHYQSVQNSLANSVQASNFKEQDKQEIQEYIISGNLTDLQNKIRAVESQYSESSQKREEQLQKINQLKHSIQEAVQAKENMKQLEDIAQAKVQELRECQKIMKLAMTNTISSHEDEMNLRPLGPGSVIQFRGTSVIGIVRYVGPVEGQEGEFAGLELESGGDTNGTYNGKTYFKVDGMRGRFMILEEIQNQKRLYPDELLGQLNHFVGKLAEEKGVQQ